jgi:methionine-rich copper-binding protein CopC
MIMRHAAILPLVATLFGSGAAQAHAMLERADPRVGSAVSAAPSQVTLWFTQNIEHSFSSVEVVNAAGARVSVGKPRIDGANSTMQVGLKALAPGVYTVRWRALSVDTHTTQGSFTFQVGQ